MVSEGGVHAAPSHTGGIGMRRRSAGLSQATYVRSLLVGVILALLTASPVLGDPFGTNTTDTGPFADSGFHDYCWGYGFDAVLHDNAASAMSSLDVQTDMVDSFRTTCSSVTDIFWFDGDLPGAARGGTRCVTWTTYGVICNSFDIMLDPAAINVGSEDELDTTKTACHEVGHTTGLSHASTGTDCMISGEMPSTDGQWRSYNAHHVDHINSRY